MTDQPAAQIPPYDMGNPLLQPDRSLLTTFVIPAGAAPEELCAITLRTTSATVTAFVTRAVLDTWIASLTQTRDQMSAPSGLIVPSFGGTLNGHRR